jgi:predicted MFS family arabinose efflux permease
VPLVVIFSSFFPAEQSVRATAVLTLVSAAARITATALNGYLNEWGGYILAFFVASGAAALAAVNQYVIFGISLGFMPVLAKQLGAADLAKSIPLLFLIQGCIGIAHGSGYPVLMGLTIRDIPFQQRSTAMGLHQTVYAAGIFIGPWASERYHSLRLFPAMGIPMMAR